ncbi:(d)CMP kinase [Coprobacter sp.]
MQNSKIVIAIDGFSSCGKSTMAKELARKIGYIYIDSGAMYRAVTLYCLNNNLIKEDSINESELKKVIDSLQITFKINPDTGKPETYLNGKNVEKEIRTMQVSDKVSPVSAIPFVRTAMVAQQQALGKQKGVVMDGRDIGTTVFPDAELKIFVTASPETRAQRRVDELTQKGTKVSFEEVLDNVKKRDYLDQHREVSPLRKADDALLLDNSNMSLAEQDIWLMEQYNRICEK